MGQIKSSAELYSQNIEVFDNQIIQSADVLIDRQAIELEATDLLKNRSDVEFGYKTEQTYQSDARTALFEALTASGHLSRVELSGTLEYIHRTMLMVHLNAFSDALPEHEKARQFQELCEELTRQRIEQLQFIGGVSANLQVATISDDPSTAGMSETQAKALGYRPQNNKGMVRNTHLVFDPDGTCTRVTEQVSRSNSNAMVSADFLAENNIPIRLHSKPDVRVLGSQLLHEMADGVVGLQRRLDAFCGSGIRYGEELNEQQVSYEYLAEESAAREVQAEAYIITLASYMMNLDTRELSGEINKAEHDELLKTEIHRILQAICVMSPEYAIDCFGDQAAPGYYQASNMARSGDVDGSTKIVHQNQSKEQTVSLCGMSITNKRAQELGVEPDSLGSLIKFGLEHWGTRIGACRVPDCMSPKPTEVGACDVCTGGCEPLFNRGWSLSRITKYYRSLRRAAKHLVKRSVTIWDIFSTPSHTNKQNVRS